MDITTSVCGTCKISPYHRLRQYYVDSGIIYRTVQRHVLFDTHDELNRMKIVTMNRVRRLVLYKQGYAIGFCFLQSVELRHPCEAGIGNCISKFAVHQ